MKQIGDFWLPDVDVRWGKHRRKSIRLFENRGRIGPFIPILDDQGRGDRDTMLGGEVPRQGPATGNHDGSRWNDEGRVRGFSVDLLVHQIKEGRRSGENRTGPDDSSPANDRSLIYAAVSTDEPR